MKEYKVIESSGRFTFSLETLKDLNTPLSREEAEQIKEKLEECVPFQLEVVKIDSTKN
ncbi:hypothetical protein [Fictibacillus terranigra]|uniref:Uncharacterized protein n=1 Tax=Fictibacillus terranigra TaxID=3058424 RepID=A0ABT8E8J1_9BACL|nr:hypothetical protein [Fictibacillus sp. CENA-BCM004]MDN4074233.1 hypothetical protein [Fictibacillus sp. CENA-BCM004]